MTIYSCWSCDSVSETASACVDKRFVEIEIDGIDSEGDIHHDLTDLGPCTCVCHNNPGGGVGVQRSQAPDGGSPGAHADFDAEVAALYDDEMERVYGIKCFTSADLTLIPQTC